MSPLDYEFLRDLLGRTSGLSLGPDKQYLLESRLVPLAQSLGLLTLEELVARLRRSREPQLQSAVVEAMTTNETSFFRDKQPFDELKAQLLPEMLEQRRTQRTLQIWCAASSTGQEPYSLLMLLHSEIPELRDWKIEITATDIAQKALDRAARGIYSQFEVQRGLPIRLLMKYFTQTPEGWQIHKTLREQVRWKQLNLLENFQHLGRFDIIFCRNVLIYFDPPTKQGVIDRMRGLVRGDGYLILGAAETLLGLGTSFTRHTPCRSAVYRPNEPAHAVG